MSFLILLVTVFGATEVTAGQRTEALTVTRTTDLEVAMTRGFAAARSEVFAALTTPAQLRRWLVAGERELVLCEIDLRPGGTFRYEFQAPDGSKFGMFGTFREVVSGTRIVYTESYDGLDWEPLVVRTELSEDAGQSVLVTTIVYPSKEICDIDLPNLKGTRQSMTDWMRC